MPYSEESSPWQRMEGPLVLAGALVSAYGLVRKSPNVTAGAAFGALGLLAWKERSQTAEGRQPRFCKVAASFAVRCSRQRAYREWRDFENLPRFMRHIKSVAPGPDSRLRWTAEGLLGSTFHWNTQLVEDIENERIAWRSLPGSLIENNGSIEFRQAAPERGIVITLKMQYGFPAASIAKAFLSVIGRNPGFTVREDLRRFKAFLETGEIPTTADQPHGPRGVQGHITQMLLRESANMAHSPRHNQQLQPMRSAA